VPRHVLHRTAALFLALVVVLGLQAAVPAVPAVHAVPAVPADGHARGPARVVEEREVGTRLTDLTVRSPALGGDARVRLLTPDGWARRGLGDRWPVLYLLHGGFEPETYRTWTRESDIEEIPALRDVLVVMPEGGTAGFYSDWWNGGKGGPPAWERFHLDELRPLLERGYGAGPRRAVAGLSMGGFGAISYAARRPGMFTAAASFSGPVHLLHPRMREIWPLVEEAYGGRGSLYGLWGDPVAQRGVWQAHDPYHLAERLRGTRLFLSVGDGHPGPLDPPGSAYDPSEAELRLMNRSLVGRLGGLRIALVARFHTGTHHPAYGERELHHSLPLLLDGLLCDSFTLAGTCDDD